MWDRWERGLDGSMFLTGSGEPTRAARAESESGRSWRSPREAACSVHWTRASTSRIHPESDHNVQREMADIVVVVVVVAVVVFVSGRWCLTPTGMKTKWGLIGAVRWRSWLSHLSNTQKVPSSSLGRIIASILTSFLKLQATINIGSVCFHRGAERHTRQMAIFGLWVCPCPLPFPHPSLTPSRSSTKLAASSTNATLPVRVLLPPAAPPCTLSLMLHRRGPCPAHVQ